VIKPERSIILALLGIGTLRHDRGVDGMLAIQSKCLRSTCRRSLRADVPARQSSLTRSPRFPTSLMRRQVRNLLGETEKRLRRYGERPKGDTRSTTMTTRAMTFALVMGASLDRGFAIADRPHAAFREVSMTAVSVPPQPD
jgi:hypothetical protein